MRGSGMLDEIYAGALVRWSNGGDPAWGVVSSVAANRKSLDVHLDGGANHTFAWPNEALEHVLLDVGQPVLLTATNERGVVAARTPAGGKTFYSVSLAAGGQKTVAEDGVRIAIETDPIARLRQGLLDSARSTNLRLAA